MKIATGLLSCALILLGQAGSAGAATVRPSGVYAFTLVENCEAQFNFTTESVRLANNNTDTAVRMINSVHNGSIGLGVGTITFTPKTASGGNFSVKLTNINGGALRINKNGGVNVTTQSQSFSGTYTFTATSLTLNPNGGSAMAYTMAYGALPASGAPASVHLGRQSASGETTNCVESLTATR